ncbi:hypothetical protein [Telluribacter humicola]|uniref:hypothetical protein n=1 Tax=Telluribacter humicola TaxID=1720261 RepID=UPI001A97CA0D|nr:hypothetical protein [Telluribacter humicola]
MSILFYIFTIAALMRELLVLKNPKKYHDQAKCFHTKKFDDLTDTQKISAGLLFFYLLWILVGLFTSHWLPFLFLFLLWLVPVRWVWLRWTRSLTVFFVLLFILINRYHLHIDLWRWVTA